MIIFGVRAKVFYVEVIMFTLLLCLTLAPSQGYAQNVISDSHNLFSKVFQKDRKIDVYYSEKELPEKFAVLLVLDAQDEHLWNLVKSTVTYLHQSNDVIPILLVGIHLENRYDELNSLSNKLTEHLESEVIGFVREKYSKEVVASMLGHSSAGGFCMNMFLENSAAALNNFISISPTFDDGENRLTDADLIDDLREYNGPGKFMFSSTGNIGSIDQESMTYCAKGFSIFSKQKNNRIVWQHDVVDGQGHWSSVSQAINNGLIELSRNYRIDLKILTEFSSTEEPMHEQIDDFLERKKNQFENAFIPTESFMRYAASNFSDIKEYKIAQEILDWSIKEDPFNFKLYMSKSQLLEKMDSSKERIKMSYQKTLDVLNERKDSYEVSFYERKRNWLQNKLKGM